MLTLLPDLLTYQLFAPTLLRIAAACMFVYLAYVHYQNREKIMEIRFSILGKVGVWITWLAILIELTVAGALFFGCYTQIAAIVGAAVALKNIVWAGRYPDLFLLSRGAAFLLLAILLSLLVTGAGALAFDLPL